MADPKRYLIYQYYHHIPDTGKTVNAGYNYHDFSRSSIEEYAKKIGVDYRFIDREIPVSPFYGIFLPFTEGWCHDYDAVCFIDSDILATVHAPSVFDSSSQDLISIHLMTSARPRGKDLSDVEHFMKNGIFNSGVVVFPRSSYDSLIENTKTLQDYHESINRDHESIGSLDQAFLNYYIRDVAKEHHNLDKKFNYNLSRNSVSTRFSNYLIHYHRSFKKMIKEDYHNGSIIKGLKIEIDTHEMYQPRLSSVKRQSQVVNTRDSIQQKMLDHKMIRKSSDNHNVLARMHTKPYAIHSFFEETKYEDILHAKFEFKDEVDQDTADKFYENSIVPSIKDRISMYYETRPSTKKIPSKYALLALHNEKRSAVNAVNNSHNQNNIRIAKYAKLIASHMNLPLIVKQHPFNNDRNMIGYLMQDNYTVVNNNVCDLLDDADIVITANSRVGFESVVRLKKTILFEPCSYQDACHVFSDLASVFEYATNDSLDENYIKRYILEYFTRFLGYEYDDDKA